MRVEKFFNELYTSLIFQCVAQRGEKKKIGIEDVKMEMNLYRI